MFVCFLNVFTNNRSNAFYSIPFYSSMSFLGPSILSKIRHINSDEDQLTRVLTRDEFISVLCTGLNCHPRARRDEKLHIKNISPGIEVIPPKISSLRIARPLFNFCLEFNIQSNVSLFVMLSLLFSFLSFFVSNPGSRDDQFI